MSLMKVLLEYIEPEVFKLVVVLILWLILYCRQIDITLIDPNPNWNPVQPFNPGEEIF